MRRSYVTYVVLSLIVTLASCGNNGKQQSPAAPKPDPVGFGSPPSWMDSIIVDTTMISRNPLENDEAEWLALYLSRDLVAPLDLYERVNHDLQAIRSAYGDLEPPLQGAFREWWAPGILQVGLTDQAVSDYRAGTYTDLDELNRLFQLDRINENSLDRSGWLTLHFRGCLHPARLEEFYSNVGSIEGTSIWWFCCDGDRIYPWYANDKLTYLFREGWGDCPAGCIYSRYWYFRTSDDGSVEYVGSYTPSEDEAEPAWWAEASRNKTAFLHGHWY